MVTRLPPVVLDRGHPLVSALTGIGQVRRILKTELDRLYSEL